MVRDIRFYLQAHEKMWRAAERVLDQTDLFKGPCGITAVRDEASAPTGASSFLLGCTSRCPGPGIGRKISFVQRPAYDFSEIIPPRGSRT